MVVEVSEMLPACRLDCGGFSLCEINSLNVFGRLGWQGKRVKGELRFPRFCMGVRTVAVASALHGPVEEFEGRGVLFNQYVVIPR